MIDKMIDKIIDKIGDKGDDYVGLLSVILIAFIVLKLCGVLVWPWVWILMPLWIILALYALVFLISLFH